VTFARRLLIAGSAMLCIAVPALAQLPPLRAQPFASGFSAPIAFVQDPTDPARQFVVEQGGRIKVIYGGAVRAALFLDLSASIAAGGERGLLGFALAPDYATSRRFFVYFTNPSGDIVIARFRRSAADAFVADASTRFDLKWGSAAGQAFIPHPVNANHNGGCLLFGPDGYLYAGVGDGGSGGDPPNNAQNPAQLLGKILRIDVNVADANAQGYAIPATNPFQTGNTLGAMREIWAFGLRNPWRFGFDDPARGGTGALVIGDVGQGAWEEVDYEPAQSGGRNYGWRNYEGTHLFDNSVAPAYGPLRFPVLEYSHTVGHSITGGTVYRGLALGAGYNGRYFYADFVNQRVWSTRITLDAGGEATGITGAIEHTVELSGGPLTFASVSAFGTDANGELYLVLHDRGAVVKLVAAAPGGRTLHYGTDFGGAAGPDLAVYRPELGRWFINGVGTIDYGLRGDIPVPGLYGAPRSGAAVDTVAVFRPSTGRWFVPDMGTIAWGLPGDVPVAARYSGGRYQDIAIFRPSTGTWYVRNGVTAAWGLAGDVPVPTDYDGDGVDDIAVYRPSNGTWYLRGLATIQWGLPGDIPVPADYDGDGIADVAVFRPSTGQWLVRGTLAIPWGMAGDVPIPMDLDRDGRAELIVFRPSTGTWYARNMVTGAIQTVTWGRAGDIPLGRIALMPRWRIGDVDGDLRADLSVFRPSTVEWLSTLSSGGPMAFSRIAFGMSTDTPVSRDYDGDGLQDPAIFRASTNTWYLLFSTTGYANFATVPFGAAGDIPVPADYDGDGRSDVATFRPSTGRWTIMLSASGVVLAIDWGLTGDVPVAVDFDGDGRADPAVFRPSLGRWFILDRFTGTYAVRDWGLNGDIPVAADYDGDGVADLAVYRPSQGRWHVLTSSDGMYAFADWGLIDDVPMPADYDGDGRTDLAVYRPSTGRWYGRGLFTRDWGLMNDIPVPKRP
jgi:glucose/arabinose dehydrogenase